MYILQKKLTQSFSRLAACLNTCSRILRASSKGLRSWCLLDLTSSLKMIWLYLRKGNFLRKLRSMWLLKKTLILFPTPLVGKTAFSLILLGYLRHRKKKRFISSKRFLLQSPIHFIKLTRIFALNASLGLIAKKFLYKISMSNQIAAFFTRWASTVKPRIPKSLPSECSRLCKSKMIRCH